MNFDGARWRYLSQQYYHQGQQAQHEGCQGKVSPQQGKVPSALQHHPCLLQAPESCVMFKAAKYLCSSCWDVVMSLGL